jgi:hypothetical protein
MKADPNVRLFGATLSKDHGYSALRIAARNIVRRALRLNHTQREAAEWLGIHERALRRLLEHHPDLRPG